MLPRAAHSLASFLRQLIQCITLGLLVLNLSYAAASGGESPQTIKYPDYPPAPPSQSEAQAKQKSLGCVSCHTKTDQASMHSNPAVVLGCTDCHGGNADILKPASMTIGDEAYRHTLDQAHVQPRYPRSWNYPSSANPKHSYTLLNKESPEFVRFVNPGDYRVAEKACGACHKGIIKAAQRSLMSTSAMLWGGAAYNNGILPFKNYIMGEAYTPTGEAAAVEGPLLPNPESATEQHGILPILYPLPAWETVKPGDIFRVFERGGRNILNLFPETGIPNSLGLIQRLEEPGRPDIRQSNRGPGTGARVAIPVLNITKTRLNDPHMWFMGTSDQPGDFRSSGCSGCHVIYANDRDPKHSGPYASYGHMGQSQSLDPTIPKGEMGHPLQHAFTRAIPTSTCMSCHMHQPNMFMNTYLGYTMWDYESDAPFMWPEKQQYPSDSESRAISKRNPEGAAVRGKWADLAFLKDVSKLNPELKDTQFADYHGHGWNFRAIYKRDRDGNLLDKNNKIVSDSDPNKFEKAVHMSSIHADVGMHCVDCHFAQDAHGNGFIYGEVASAVEIDCVDCHGTVDRYPSLISSGPAAPPNGTDLGLLRNPDGKKRFEWIGDSLYQRSLVNPGLKWKMSLLKDSVNPNHPDYNKKSAQAKLMSTNSQSQHWGLDVPTKNQAHSYDKMECYSCHTSWTTSCAGCHLPIEANWKTERQHYEGGETRNFATYNPQVSRDQMFMLGRRGKVNGGRIAPVRSSSALVLSSKNANRELIYTQQPPIAASGYSSQAFNPHFPHTTRKTETKTCVDCHISQENDNNAIMAQLLLLGTNFVNFVGYHAYMGTDGDISAIRVTEWDEPQAVVGSYLHKYAYPDYFNQHQIHRQILQQGHHHDAGRVGCLQLRGEYLYVAEGENGMRVYDVASIANKGFSQRMITAPFSPLGQDTHIASHNATCLALPTNQPIHPERNKGELMRVTNQEQPFHPIYNYALITDSEEGLILTDVNTLADGDPLNNFLNRQLTWNENDILRGARHITIGGHKIYIIADAGLVILNLDNPLKPILEHVLPLNSGRASALQFRYLFVTDQDGLKVIDVTEGQNPKFATDRYIPFKDAQRIYLARTYAYIAAGKEGLAIVDIKSPERMSLYQLYTANGQIADAQDVVVATTNASLFAYIADGVGGLKVVQLTSPESQPKFYGFSPAPVPQLIAHYPTKERALSLSKGLERDRAVDESGHQIAVFGRLDSGPLSLEDMKKLYLNESGALWRVKD